MSPSISIDKDGLKIDWTPNPGSDEAIAAGCTCPVLDNAHGRGVPWPRTDGRDPNEYPSFWTSPDCPLHGKHKRRRPAMARKESKR